MTRFGMALALVGWVLGTAVPAVAQHDHGAMSGGSSVGSAAKGQAVTFANGGQGELFLPTGHAGQPGPGLVLIHEWWGLNDWVRQQAAEFAAAGYTVVAVDLYHGQVANDPETAHELSRGLPHDQAVKELRSALAFLRARPEVGPDGRVGTVGWCFGGGLALEFAIASPALKAVVVNYGALPTDEDQIRKIVAPVLGNFGAQDKGIPPAAVDAFAKAMRDQSKSVDVKEYPDAGHAFENENNKTGYNSADAADAKARTTKFLADNLKASK